MRIGLRGVTALAGLSVFGLTVANAQVQLGIVTVASIGTNYVDFAQSLTGSPFVPSPDYGTFEVNFVAAGGLFSLAGVSTGESGSIQSINESAGFADTPFITFSDGGSNLALHATDLVPGTTTGPLNITGFPSGSALSFTITGTVSSSTAGALGHFNLVCAATFAGGSSTELLDSLDAGTPIDTDMSCTIDVVQTPPQATRSAIDAVNVLRSQGVLNGGQDNSLVVKLQHATDKMNAGNDAAAIGDLDSFIAEVNNLSGSGVLSSSQAAPLISAAEAVVTKLS